VDAVEQFGDRQLSDFIAVAAEQASQMPGIDPITEVLLDGEGETS
jgi:hypothetical protein